MKLGFVLMVTVELNTLTMQDLFVAFTRIKMEEAATEASKY